MKVAMTVWDGRVSPVCDAARRIALVEMSDGASPGDCRIEESLPADHPLQLLARLRALDVNTLICGAISRPLAELIANAGIRLIPFVSGSEEEILKAFMEGRLDDPEFQMPGCCGRGRRRFRGMGCNEQTEQEEYLMNGKRRGGMGSGGGQGQGRGGRRADRMGGPNAAGPAGTCVCPKCGQREPHERGVPCAERKCPQCGAVMTKE
jgi:predicted Fe-Mo cluster-binding NifX family protein